MASLLHHNGESAPFTRDAATALLATGDFFWATLDGLDADAEHVLLHDFGFHQLAVEDAANFGQRPKVESYDDFTYWVAHGVDAAGKTVEIHTFFSPKFIVTVHRGQQVILDAVCDRNERHPLRRASAPAVSLLYLLVDTLVDSYFPRLAELDERIDQLEDEILTKPTEAQLGELFTMKRQLVAYRKSITPQRDLMARTVTGVDGGPELTDDDLRYFRDLYDHLIRISDLVDSYRDLVSGAVDTHLSMVSNRLNVVMKQLTIIATIFLPMTFFTGFFGQNFQYAVNGWLSEQWAFWVFAIGLNVASAAALLYWFRRRGWLGGESA